jgi:hypothetical protein
MRFIREALAITAGAFGNRRGVAVVAPSAGADRHAFRLESWIGVCP